MLRGELRDKLCIITCVLILLFSAFSVVFLAFNIIDEYPFVTFALIPAFIVCIAVAVWMAFKC